ncbi:MAG: hypothetical protein M1828_003652 [Chrysothrix sp. TS-e1954]|nr:MAG: hypothetical protein M1828_003652 [Chrysothrix sp. TS-e1954]
MRLLLLLGWLHLYYVLISAHQPSKRRDAGQRLLLHEHEPKTKRVAIIGAGSAGSSTAYYLKQYADSLDIPTNITVFERQSYVGGRSTTVNAYDDPSQPVELGASIFVEVNHNLVDAVKSFNLSTTAFGGRRQEDVEVLGIWNGREFVFKQTMSESRWRTWWNNALVMWRYGFGALRAVRMMQDQVGRFLKLYDYPHFPFASLSQAVADVNLTHTTSVTGELLLDPSGDVNDFAWDIVQAATRVNYAQNLGQIHGLEAMVCLAADGAMSVRGGNWRIFAEMIKSSGAHLQLNTEIESVEQTKDDSYMLRHRSMVSEDKPQFPGDSKPSLELFDDVVLAAPFHQTGISFSPALPKTPPDIPYVNLHVTLFSSPHPLNPTAFGMLPTDEAPTTILTTLQKGEEGEHGAGKAGFFSISTLRRAVNPRTGSTEFLYKIFSPAFVSDDCLTQLVGLEDVRGPNCLSLNASRPNVDDPVKEGLPNDSITWLYRKLWLSYPYLPPLVTFE